MLRKLNKLLPLALLACLLAAAPACATEPKASSPAVAQTQAQAVASHLQQISVTIHAGNAQGSGVIITRGDTSYVLTAGHVVANLRSTREIVDAGGATKTLVEFADAQIVKELVEDGRRVGETKMDAEVIRYSDADNGEDIAILRVRKKDFLKDSVRFYLESDIPAIGTDLYHVGSLLGQIGSNSMTTGIVSQIGRTLGKVEFDQTTVTAFPGSSGGGVYLRDGRYMGMLVRGAGEGFNLVVPVRRLHRWAKEAGMEWLLDEKAAVPTAEQLRKMPIEGKAPSPEKK